MRELVETLFPYIVVFYLIDGLSYVNRHHHLLLVSHFGITFNMLGAGSFFINISPLGQVIKTHDMPFCFTVDGIYVLSNRSPYDHTLYQPEDFHFVAYQELTRLEQDGKSIKINNEVVVNLPSAAGAAHLTALIQNLKQLPPPQRRREIKSHLAEATDFHRINAVGRDQAPYFFYLKLLCALLFCNTFILLPLALYVPENAYLNMTALLLNILVTYVFILTLTAFFYKKIHRLKTGRTLYEMFLLIISPVSTIHVLEHLTKDAYASFDYLTVAAKFLPADQFQTLLRKELYQVGQAKSRPEGSEWSEFWQSREQALHRLITQTEMNLPTLLAPPARRDKTSAGYCPLCLDEFRAGVDCCADCEVALKSFTGVGENQEAGVKS